MSGLPEIITSIPGPRSLACAVTLEHCESRNITYIAADFPVFWESAAGSLVRDVDGNTFLDFTSAFGVAAVGHGHPKVVQAVQAQAGKLLHGMGDVHPSAVKVALCERLAQMAPFEDARVILGQNGADAVEAALKTAMLATGRPGVLAFEGGYHGLSYGTLAVTSRNDFREPFGPQVGQFARHVPYGCAMSQIDAQLAQGQIGAVLVEPIQGRGGIILPPRGWLADLRSLCTRYGCLLILDEIFTGWGRTGDWFACQYEGVAPDILCIGKAMGGGLPISACAAPASVMAAWPKSTGEALHTSTFLGNPLACAAALATIAVMEEENLPARARQIGDFFHSLLDELRHRHLDAVRAVRGRGLMLGLEMASQALGLSLVPRALQRGLIVLPAGDGRVLEFVPSLLIAKNQILWCIETLDDLLTP